MKNYFLKKIVRLSELLIVPIAAVAYHVTLISVEPQIIKVIIFFTVVIPSFIGFVLLMLIYLWIKQNSLCNVSDHINNHEY